MPPALAAKGTLMAQTKHAAHHALDPLDHGRINVLDADAVACWCKELHCTQEQLKAAVAQVGTHVAAVRERLHHR
jgi:Protein of unknown function (DUF3606)